MVDSIGCADCFPPCGISFGSIAKLGHAHPWCSLEYHRFLFFSARGPVSPPGLPPLEDRVKEYREVPFCFADKLWFVRAVDVSWSIRPIICRPESCGTLPKSNFISDLWFRIPEVSRHPLRQCRRIASTNGCILLFFCWN